MQSVRFALRMGWDGAWRQSGDPTGFPLHRRPREAPPWDLDLLLVSPVWVRGVPTWDGPKALDSLGLKARRDAAGGPSQQPRAETWVSVTPKDTGSAAGA